MLQFLCFFNVLAKAFHYLNLNSNLKAGTYYSWLVSPTYNYQKFQFSTIFHTKEARTDSVKLWTSLSDVNINY